jgi:hypothetical protein
MLPLECVKIFGAMQFARNQKSSGDLKTFFLCIPNSKFKENKFITRFFLDQALCKYERLNDSFSMEVLFGKIKYCVMQKADKKSEGENVPLL